MTMALLDLMRLTPSDFIQIISGLGEKIREQYASQGEDWIQSAIDGIYGDFAQSLLKLGDLDFAGQVIMTISTPRVHDKVTLYLIEDFLKGKHVEKARQQVSTLHDSIQRATHYINLLRETGDEQDAHGAATALEQLVDNLAPLQFLGGNPDPELHTVAESLIAPLHKNTHTAAMADCYRELGLLTGNKTYQKMAGQLDRIVGGIGSGTVGTLPCDHGKSVKKILDVGDIVAARELAASYPRAQDRCNAYLQIAAVSRQSKDFSLLAEAAEQYTLSMISLENDDQIHPQMRPGSLGWSFFLRDMKNYVDTFLERNDIAGAQRIMGTLQGIPYEYSFLREKVRRFELSAALDENNVQKADEILGQMKGRPLMESYLQLAGKTDDQKYLKLARDYAQQARSEGHPASTEIGHPLYWGLIYRYTQNETDLQKGHHSLSLTPNPTSLNYNQQHLQYLDFAKATGRYEDYLVALDDLQQIFQKPIQSNKKLTEMFQSMKKIFGEDSLLADSQPDEVQYWDVGFQSQMYSTVLQAMSDDGYHQQAWKYTAELVTDPINQFITLLHIFETVHLQPKP